MSTYSYSVTSDFGGTNPILNQLHNEIDSESGITKTLNGISKTNDNVDIIFDESLSAGEQTTLDGIVSSHTPVSITHFRLTDTVMCHRTSTITTEYVLMDSFVYNGSVSVGDIIQFNVDCRMDTGVTNFTIRIFDVTKEKNIAEGTFNNTNNQINAITSISNLPRTQSIFEILMKKTGGSTTLKAYLNFVEVCY